MNTNTNIYPSVTPTSPVPSNMIIGEGTMAHPPVPPREPKPNNSTAITINDQTVPPIKRKQVKSSSGGSSWMLYVLLLSLLIAVIVLIIVLVAYTTMSYHQLSDIQSNTEALEQQSASSNGNGNGQCSCNAGSLPSSSLTVDTTELSKYIASKFSPNADAQLVRPDVDLPQPTIDYVFDFNEPHAEDSFTPNGYSKQAFAENWLATKNQAAAQTLFQLEVNGSNSPHHHPDGVEILHVFQGHIEVTRIEPNGGLTFTHQMTANMSVIFPRGHIHFQRNIGTGVARYISTLNSQFPGVMSEAQRICTLPIDVLYSMFSFKTAQTVIQMCGIDIGNGTPKLPANIIHYHDS